MVAVRASHSCFCHFIEPSDIGKARHNLGFSMSVSNMIYAKLDTIQNNSVVAKGKYRFVAEVSPVESKKLGSNGRAIKMVPTNEVMKSKDVTPQKMHSVNGSKAKINGSKVAINGSKVAINGTNQVKKDRTSALVKTRKEIAFEELPSTEELKVFTSDEGFNWTKDSYNHWQRTADIWSCLLSLRMRVLFDNAKWTYPGGFTEEKQSARRKKTASWLREQILQLGPTFIKLGQFSSTRSDLFPREFVDEFAKLQDRVPAFSPEKAKTFIQNELGASVDVLFKDFEDRPIAAASLGQVHRAILHNGEKVVVKVQRPGLKKLFDIDLRNLKLIAEYFQRSDTFGGPTKDWLSIYHDCSGILYEEIDYINEGKNADRFRRDFRNINWVRVPVIFWDYTSTKVLTLEYVPGIKINCLNQLDERGFSRSQIASRTIESYLIQVLKAGFFHADPHPGNLAIDKDGSLIYYDFGMMGEIKSFIRERLIDLFYAFYEKNPDKVLRCLIELEVLQPTGDLSSVRRSVKFFLDNLLSQSPDHEKTLAAVREDLFAIAMDQPIRFPSTFTFFMKAFSTLEGIGNTLDPKFSFAKIAAPYAQELLDSEQKPSGSELVGKISKQANEATNYTVSMPYRIQRIEEFVKQLESGDLKLRVTALESERAARKATILQMATMNAALSGTLLNIGVTLSITGNQFIATGSFIGAGIFLILLIRSMQRVKKLDKYEKMF